MTVSPLRNDAPEPNEPTAEIYNVSPAVAKRWLQRNVHNRRISQRIVTAYARDMVAGNWQVTGEAIKFDTSGALADGQHRLLAVVQANVTVTMLVVRGVAMTAQAVMDSGRKRSASDNLSLEGRKDASILQAATRFALAEPGAGFVSPGEEVKNATNSEVYEFIETFDAELTNAAMAARHYYPAIQCPPSVLAVAWMNLVQIDRDACAEFFNSIAEQRTNGTGDPRLALARRLQSLKQNREELAQAGYLSLVLRAWNAWRSDKSLSNLPVRIGSEIIRIPERLK